MSACTGVVDFDIYEYQYILFDATSQKELQLNDILIMDDGFLQWEVYLPAGRWKDTRDGKEYEGGCTVLADAPVDSMPVFEKL